LEYRTTAGFEKAQYRDSLQFFFFNFLCPGRKTYKNARRKREIALQAHTMRGRKWVEVGDSTHYCNWLLVTRQCSFCQLVQLRSSAISAFSVQRSACGTYLCYRFV